MSVRNKMTLSSPSLPVFSGARGANQIHPYEAAHGHIDIDNSQPSPMYNNTIHQHLPSSIRSTTKDTESPIILAPLHPFISFVFYSGSVIWDLCPNTRRLRLNIID